MSFVANSKKDEKDMLAAIGAGDIEALFSDIPENIRLRTGLDLPPAVSEIEAEKLLRCMEKENLPQISFLGAGVYPHYIPAAVDQLTLRSEFYTAYTPYQPEISQGTLTAIFEFQTMICRLTGMDVANASMYDGATAAAEAVLMCLGMKKKSRVVLSKALHPNYRAVIETYAWANDISLAWAECSGGVTEAAALQALLDDDTGAVVIQNPGFFGCIEDVAGIAECLGEKKIPLIVVVNEMVSLGLLKSPGQLGADIVCGEAQSLGNPVGFGGPLLGFMAAKQAFMRKMPGRFVGKTVDADGKTAYVLTLQAREQHIRREKATSNICTNEGLCALRAVIYLSLVGNRLRDLAILNHSLAAYMKKELAGIGCVPLYPAPFFNEFTVKLKNAKSVLEQLSLQGIVLGVDLGCFQDDLQDAVLVCCTEDKTKQDIDAAVAALKALTA